MSPPYDEALFGELVAGWKRGEVVAAPPPGTLEPLRPGDVTPLPSPGTPEHARLAAIGNALLREGRVAALVVAGGAGTRFGGAVKALVPVVEGRTFLDLKLLDAERTAARVGHAVPVALMTSFLTSEGIAEHLAAHPPRVPVLPFLQAALPRLEPTGEMARDASGAPSLAPSGHGDVFRALRTSGVGERLRALGVEHVYFSNVDNLAATLDPVVLGLHADGGAAMTVEVTPRRAPDGALDVGAAPVRVGGQLQLVEKVDPAAHATISTNNIAFRLAPLLAGAHPGAVPGGEEDGGGCAGHPVRAGDRRGVEPAPSGRRAAAPGALHRGAARGPGHDPVRAGEGPRGPGPGGQPHPRAARAVSGRDPARTRPLDGAGWG